MDELYKAIQNLPKEVIEYFILKLMLEDKISFADIAKTHVDYLERVKRGETMKLMNLRSEVIDLWCSTKKELPSKLVALMREAKANGWANLTEEQIEKSKWNR